MAPLISVLITSGFLLATTGRGLTFFFLFYSILPVLVVMLGFYVHRVAFTRPRRDAISHLGLATVLVGCWVIFAIDSIARYDFGDDLRWVCSSARYKRIMTTSKQPSIEGMLKPPPDHLDWDDWGGFGSDEEADIAFV